MVGMVDNSFKGTKTSSNKDFEEIPMSQKKYPYKPAPKSDIKPATYIDDDGRTRLKARIEPLKGMDVSGMSQDDIARIRNKHYSTRWNKNNIEKYRTIVREHARRSRTAKCA